ncbi:MAG: allantoicase, partial [Gammaproteobacteria bacterium]|nr:allantoicase [Gammaproteobacteria bacterium]
MNTGKNNHGFAHSFINLAQARLGARALYASDDFFAPCERMLQASEAVFIPGKYDSNGKWMDGWESRRKRGPGHDFCVVRLAFAGVLHGVDIDTSHFIGNHPPSASLEACYSPKADPDDSTDWIEVLPATALQADSHHLCTVDDNSVYSHVRLNIYPDGGIARLRVYGQVVCDWSKRDAEAPSDLAAVANGGRALACSQAGFGSSMHNLNLPGRGVDMGDGWETPRRRGPGHDWVILELGCVGKLTHLEIDTAHYKGNYPDRVSVQAAHLSDDDTDT